MCGELRSLDVPVKEDLDQAWRGFSGSRVNYDEVLVRLCALTMAPPATWSSDPVGQLDIPKLGSDAVVAEDHSPATTRLPTTATTSYSNTGLAASSQYCYTVAAYDIAGNASNQSVQSCATTSAAADTTAPSVPSRPDGRRRFFKSD